MHPLLELVVLVVGACFVSARLMVSLARITEPFRGVFRLILLPGVVLHELAHAAACVAVGGRVRRISFWNDRGGGHVRCELPPLPAITVPFISLAPVPAGLTVIALIGPFWTHRGLPVQLLVGYVTISIAATLAPSRTDLWHARWTVALAFVVSPFLLLTLPPHRVPDLPLITTWNRALEPTFAGVLLLWLAVTLIAHLRR